MGRKTSAAVEARKLARERRMKLDADRDARDRRIEEAAAEVFVAQTDRAAALAQVSAAEAAMGAAVRRLVDDEGLTQSQVAELIDADQGEVRRLSKLADGPDEPAAPKAAAGTTGVAARR